MGQASSSSDSDWLDSVGEETAGAISALLMGGVIGLGQPTVRVECA